MRQLMVGVCRFHRVFASISLVIACICLLSVGSASQDVQQSASGGDHAVSSTQYNWHPVRIGGGGYVTGIVGHPAESGLIYIRTDVGGAYRWDAANSQWLPILDGFGSDKQTYYNVESLNVDPSNPNILYAAVGRNIGGRKEILRSTDKGASWTETGWYGGEMFGNGDYRWAGERLAVDPHRSNIVYYGSRENGLWRNENPTVRGNWTRIPLTLVPAGSGKTAVREGTSKVGVTFVAFDQNGGTNADGATNIIYAGAWGDGVYFTTDAGITWNHLSGSPQYPVQGKVALDGTLYVTHEYDSYRLGGVARCTRDSDCTEVKGLASGGYSGLSVDPADAKTVMVSRHNSTVGNEIYRTTDGGASWSRINYTKNNLVPWWPGHFWFARTSAILIDPFLPKRVWAADWYGIWRTDDITAGASVWTNYEVGHEEVVVHTLTSPTAGSAALFSGVADVSGFRHTMLDAFPTVADQLTGTQDNNSYAVCPTNANVVYRVGTSRSKGTGNGFKSTDNGKTWTLAFDPVSDPVLPDNTRGGRIVVTAADCNKIVWLPVGDSPYSSVDGGQTWQRSQGVPKKNIITNEWLAPTQPLAANQTSDDDSIYLYDPGMGFYRSTNGGADFTVAKGNGLPFSSTSYWMVKSVPNQSGGVWVSLYDQGLYVSTDYGASFTKLRNVASVQAFAFGKAGAAQPATVYFIGKLTGDTQSENRVYRSDDMGSTWTRINDDDHKFGKASIIEGDGQVYGRVYIGTSGRGIVYGVPAQ